MIDASDKPATAAPIATWTFERSGERLIVHRDLTDGRALRLVITGGGDARTVSFTDVGALVMFQQDMEAFLIRTGWSLSAFSPDRRSGRDRRGFPRVEPDRRRWWTDVWQRGDAPHLD